MKRILSLFVMCAMAMMLTLSACEKEGPAERAGEEIDQGMERAGDAVEDAADEVEDAVD